MTSGQDLFLSACFSPYAAADKGVCPVETDNAVE